MADTKRTKSEQDKINRKTKLTKARNKRSLSAPKKKTSTAVAKRTKRRSPAKRKGFLSAMTGPEAKNAFRSMASGGVGGFLYLVYEDQVDLGSVTNLPEKKAGIAIFGAYLLATMGKRPDTASGIAGATMYDFFKTKGLLQDSAGTQMKRMKYANPLDNIPTHLSDNQMYLAQTGQMDLQDASNMDLAEDGSGFSYEPPYAQTYTF